VAIETTRQTASAGRSVTAHCGDRRESHVGEERITGDLVKLGIRVSPRTVRRYPPTSRTPRAGTPSQPWSTFVRNHASTVLACDFFIRDHGDVSVCSTCSSWWKSALDASGTGTWLNIRPPSGPRNSFACA